jgi:hypothetical protein
MPEHWKDEPDEHDFPAATSYLTLHFDEGADIPCHLVDLP